MSGPRIAVVQHEADCPPALFGDWLTDAGAELDICHAYAAEDLPDPATYDALVVLGGAMGANDDADSPWLAPVRMRIRTHAADGVPVLGICLGHQLAAVALGGVVETNSRGQTFGLRDLGWTPDAHLDPLMSTVATPRRGVHWHDDVVTDVPEGTVVLARAEGVEVQAARFAPTVWGVQHHPEVEADLIRPVGRGRPRAPPGAGPRHRRRPRRDRRRARRARGRVAAAGGPVRRAHRPAPVT